MSTKLTKKERIEALLESGMTHTEALIKIAEENLAALKASAAKREKAMATKVDAEVLRILRDEHTDSYEKLVARARENVTSAQKRRGRKPSETTVEEATTDYDTTNEG